MSMIDSASLRPLRRFLFLSHTWIGIALCLPFALLGLTGSILVYEKPIIEFFAPPPQANAVGEKRSLQAIIDASLKNSDGMVARSLSMPKAAGAAAIVGLGQEGAPPAGRGGGRRAGGRGAREGPDYQAFVDPVSLQVVAIRADIRPYWLVLVRNLHARMLLEGRNGRPLVGWLGVGMLALGISGIVLWWPRNHRWKGAYGVKKSARGWLLHRQLHGTAGITSSIFFIILSFSGIAICFPQTTSSLVRVILLQSPSTNFSADSDLAKPITHLDGAPAIDADKALAISTAAVPHTRLLAMSLPNNPTQAYRVSLVPEGAANDALPVTVLVDPYRAAVLNVRDPWAGNLGDNVMTWQRPLHSGRGTNALYRALIFAVGLLPLLFGITGVAMWWIKRRSRSAIRVRRPTDIAGSPAE